MKVLTPPEDGRVLYDGELVNMKRNLWFSILVTLMLGATSMSSQQWNVIESRFEGDREPRIWRARYSGNRVAATTPIYDVTVCYQSARLGTLDVASDAERIAHRKLRLLDKYKAVCTVWKEKILSVEAIAHPPVHYRFIIQLDFQNRVRFVQESVVSIHEPDRPSRIRKAEEEMLEPETGRFLQNLRKGYIARIRSYPLVQFAEWFIGTRSALDEPQLSIQLAHCTAVLNGKKAKLGYDRIRFARDRLRLPAKIGDKVVLIPSFRIESLTPYRDRVKREVAALPGFALARIERADGSIRQYGKGSARGGKFELGPFEVTALRRIELQASYPLHPPGEVPSLSLDVLFRTGRPIEAYLDKGKSLPLPELRSNLRMEEVVPEVVRLAASAVNPDLGTVEGIDPGTLFDLLACGGDEIKTYPDLAEVLESTLREHREFLQSLISSGEGELSRSRKWIERDSRVVLDHPELADSLAERIRQSREPSLELVYTKEEPPSYEQPDDRSPVAHALAAAALANAASSKYSELVRDQIDHIMTMHRADSLDNWRTDEIIIVGQCAKLLAEVAADQATRGLAMRILERARKTSFEALRCSSDRMGLKAMIDVAHLISPVWRPYVNTPSFLHRHRMKITPDRLVQRMELGPGGRNVTAESLEEARLRYKSALERGIKTAKGSKWGMKKKKAWIGQFIDGWHQYLFSIHKGGHLQPYEDQFEKDLKRALKAIK